MRKSLIFLLAALSLTTAALAQQRNTFEEIRQDPNRAGTVFYMSTSRLMLYIQ